MLSSWALQRDLFVVRIKTGRFKIYTNVGTRTAKQKEEAHTTTHSHSTLGGTASRRGTPHYSHILLDEEGRPVPPPAGGYLVTPTNADNGCVI